MDLTPEERVLKSWKMADWWIFLKNLLKEEVNPDASDVSMEDPLESEAEKLEDL